MSDAVITALIVAVSSIICQVLINRGNRTKRAAEETEKAKKAAIEAALKDQRMETRLSRIEEKLDIHNGYADMISGIQDDVSDIRTNIAVIQNDIKTLYKSRGDAA